MAKISDTYNFGDENLPHSDFIRRLERMYIDLAEAINAKPDLIERSEDGQTDEVFLTQGTININTSSDKIEILSNHVDPTTVTWVTLS